MKTISTIIRVCLIAGILMISQAVWRYYYRANIPVLSEKRDIAGLPKNVSAGYLLDFVFAWENYFLFWKAAALVSVVIVTMDRFRGTSSKLDLSKTVFVLYCTLICAGTVSLFIANVLLTEGVK